MYVCMYVSVDAHIYRYVCLRRFLHEVSGLLFIGLGTLAHGYLLNVNRVLSYK